MGQEESIEKILNLGDKGSEVIILHAGSHSLKFGLASQLQPFLIPTVVAHLKKPQKSTLNVPLFGNLEDPDPFPEAEGGAQGMLWEEGIEQNMEEMGIYIYIYIYN